MAVWHAGRDMSLAIGHFAFGFAATVAALVALGLHRRVSRLGLVGALGGLWAMVPDAGELLAGDPPLDHAAWVDVFWFHHYLDTHAWADGVAGSALFVGLLVASVLVVFALDTVAWATRGEDQRVLGDGSGRERRD